MHREYRIHPAIGIARIGNSSTEGEDSYFIGPEAPGVHPLASGPFKEDGAERIKRQGARFRVYEYTFDDNFVLTDVREITAQAATIEWRVRLVNKKAASEPFLSGVSRNLSGEDPLILTVDTGEQAVSGMNQRHSVGGEFKGSPVNLGDLLTDDAGRLIVLGGHGVSFSIPDGLPIDSFVDNPGWIDDTSDGPVSATIQFAGSDPVPVNQPAWVVVAPPDFAPGISNIVTMYDVVYDIATQIDPLLDITDGQSISFTHDIYPILTRPVHLQWVSITAREGHGGSRGPNFLDTSRLAQLADNSEQARVVRQAVFNRLRNPFGGGGDMPRLNSGLTPSSLQDGVPPALTSYQYRLMERWSVGLFDADWNGAPAPPRSFDEIPDREKPAALDRAALEPCVGSPFFPGIEIGVIMAFPSTYERPFRIASTKFAGDLTAGNAVPWQADFVECGSLWWPAQRPVSVFRGGSPELWVPIREQEVGSRAAHHWMANHWHKLGFIVEEGAGYEERERAPGIPSML